MLDRFKLRYKILIPVGLVSVIIFGLIMFLVQIQIKEKAVQDISNLSLEISQRYANMVKGELDAAIGAAKAMAAAVANERSQYTPERSVVTGLLRKTLEAFPGIFGAWTAWDPNAFDGRDHAHVSADALHEESGRFLPYYIRGQKGIEETHTTASASSSRDDADKWYWYPLQTKKMLVTEPTEYEVAGMNRMMISVCVPLTEEGSGVVGLDLSLENLQDVASRIKVFDNGYGLLLSDSGMIVAHPDKARIGQNFSEFLADTNKETVAKALKEGSQAFFSQKSESSGLDMLYCMTPVALEGAEGAWSFVIGIPEDKMFENARNVQLLLLGLSLGGLTLLIGAVFVITRQIVQPIRRMVNMLKDISEGEGDLTKRLEAGSKDEIGEMARYFNAFVSKLQGIIGSISENAGTLTASAAGLSNISEKSSRGVQDLASRTTTVAAAAEELSANTISVSSNMEETSTNLSSVASATEEMSTTINEIASNTERARSTTDTASKKIDTFSGILQDLGFSANEIGKVTEAINDISAQTNLLALNATIEAARAGEAGRGFAVVANEIKELAQKTAAATDDIRSKISGIQAATGTAVNDIQSIVQVIQEVNDIVTTIAAAIEEQAMATRDVATNIAQATTGVQDANSLIAQMSTASSDIAQDITNVDNVTSELRQGGELVQERALELAQLSEQLKMLVGQFKVR